MFFLSLQAGWFPKCWNRQHLAGSKLRWWFNGRFVAGSIEQPHATLLFILLILISQQTHINAPKFLNNYTTLSNLYHFRTLVVFLDCFSSRINALHFVLFLLSIIISSRRYVIFICFSPNSPKSCSLFYTVIIHDNYIMISWSFLWWCINIIITHHNYYY